MQQFEYSDEFREMIVRLHRGKERLPKYEAYIDDHLGGPNSRLVAFSGMMCPEIEYHCGKLRDKRVLDFGCGTGATSAALAEYCDHLCAFDIDRESLEICRRRLEEHGFAGKVELYCGESIDAVERLIGSFDVIVMNGVIEHIPISIQGLREGILKSLFRLLNVPGYLFINGTPNRLYPFDVHTTQLWWIPWTRPGSEWAYKKAVARGRHAESETVSKGALGLEESGAWGATYWEIMRYLSSDRPVCVNTLRGHDRYIYYARGKRRKPDPVKFLLYLLSVRLFGAPITAFRPFLENLVIMKSE